MVYYKKPSKETLAELREMEKHNKKLWANQDAKVMEKLKEQQITNANRAKDAING